MRRYLNQMDSDDFAAIILSIITIVGLILGITAVCIAPWLLAVKLAVIGGSLLLVALFAAIAMYD